jgi:signal transduction histidine kinase
MNGDNHKQTETRLKTSNATLKGRVTNRTAVLKEMIVALQAEHLERDRTERQLREAYASLERRAGQLQALAVQLTKTEQHERERLAEILHDRLQQLLVAARYQLRRLRSDNRSDVVAEEVEKVDRIIEQCLAESRRLTVELSPPILYTVGLAAALEWLGRRIHDRHGVAVGVEADSKAEPGDKCIQALLFRAVQELLFNVVKHARTDHVQVTMVRTANQETQITVSDRGAGFDPSQLEEGTAAEGGFGLFSISERLRFLGGQFEIRSEPGKGTRAILRVPLGIITSSREVTPTPES